jgi:hypothetical protein
MIPDAQVLLALLMTAGASPGNADSTLSSGQGSDADISSLESNRGAGASPFELVPRLELRQSFVRASPGVSLHDTTTEIDIQFLDRVLLRYEGVLRVLSAPSGQSSGFSDVRLQLLVIVASGPRFVAGTFAGGVLDTASQPTLGAGKQQIFFGAGAGFKPFRWLLPYFVVQEQLSVAGDAKRPDVNELMMDLGTIAFGKGQTWYKLDLEPVADFEAHAGRVFGLLEVGRLLFRKTGLFLRSGTQLVGGRQLDYSLEVGARYLFRLDD